jgi:hypothetical protein
MSIDDFIRVSKEGRANGDFIMHREMGTLVDFNPAANRAVGKMKTTITERFDIDGCAIDVECDTRFIFFCRKTTTKAMPHKPVWKVQYHKIFYEKDKVIPVDGSSVPKFDKAELEKYPEGYQYLGAAQARIGREILRDLPTLNNEGFDKMYQAMDHWLHGKSVADILGVESSVQPRF